MRVYLLDARDNFSGFYLSKEDALEAVSGYKLEEPVIKEVDLNLTIRNFVFSYAGRLNRLSFADLRFIKDDLEIWFDDVPPPKDWDGNSDWTDDDDYVMSVVDEMLKKGEFEIVR